MTLLWMHASVVFVTTLHMDLLLQRATLLPSRALTPPCSQLSPAAELFRVRFRAHYQFVGSCEILSCQFTVTKALLLPSASLGPSHKPWMKPLPVLWMQREPKRQQRSVSTLGRVTYAFGVELERAQKGNKTPCILSEQDQINGTAPPSLLN